METVRDLIWGGGSKITADGDCSHEIKRRMLLGRKALTNPDSILKSRNITLLTKVHLIKAMVFPVVMFGCESWNVKKAERPRIDAFEVCWRRLLRVPWTARRSNQSILKEISPGVLWREWCWSWNSSTLATSCKELDTTERLHLLTYTVLVFFFLAYFTLYNWLQFHPPHKNWFKCILFNCWVILHYVYAPLLSYPFICW